MNRVTPELFLGKGSCWGNLKWNSEEQCITIFIIVTIISSDSLKSSLVTTFYFELSISTLICTPVYILMSSVNFSPYNCYLSPEDRRVILCFRTPLELCWGHIHLQLNVWNKVLHVSWECNCRSVHKFPVYFGTIMFSLVCTKSRQCSLS